MQLDAAPVDWHGRAAPTAGVIHGTDEEGVSEGEPSPALYTSMLSTGAAVPVISTGPMALFDRRSFGAASSTPIPEKRKKETSRRPDVRPTPEHPSYRPRYNRPLGGRAR